MQPVLTYPFLHVYLHTGACPVLETHWLGFANSQEFRQALQETIALGRQHQLAGWIADDRLLGAVRPRDLDWTQEHILRPLDELQLQRFALLASQDMLNRITIDRMYAAATAEIKFEVRRFNDIELARTWARTGL